MDEDFAADFPSSPDLEDSDLEDVVVTNTDETAMLSTPTREQRNGMKADLDESPTKPVQSQMLPPSRLASDQPQIPNTSSSITSEKSNQETAQPRLHGNNVNQHLVSATGGGKMSDEASATELSDVKEQDIPEDDIAPFDWPDLEHRYHDRVQELDMAQSQIVEEFRSLSDYFAVWADVGSRHEIERSFKRLKTQMTLVQQHETQLEQRRQHYVKVIDAFRSAMDLLAN